MGQHGAAWGSPCGLTWILQFSKHSLARSSCERSSMSPPSRTIQYKSMVPYCFWNSPGHSSSPFTTTHALLATLHVLITFTKVPGMWLHPHTRHTRHKEPQTTFTHVPGVRLHPEEAASATTEAAPDGSSQCGGREALRHTS